MNKNTIAERILDFLKGFPPFDALTHEQLLTISSQVKVLYVEPEDFIFKQGEDVKDEFYVVKNGAIGVYLEKKLVDQCDEGDIFGLRALIRKDQYFLDAKAIEESIVYSISSTLLQDIIISNPKANHFIIASFATNTRNPYSEDDKGTLFANLEFLKPDASGFTEAQSAVYSKNPICCSPETSIKEASLTMKEHHVGSIVITEDQKPIGIITDKDLRNKIATGIHHIDEPVTAIMSSPVLSFPPTITVAEAQIATLKYHISHLCITEDGTSQTNIIGMLSEHDIIVIHGNNPAVLIKEIKRAKSAEGLKYIREKAQNLLKNYLEQGIPMVFTSNIISAINDAVTKQVIELSIAELQQEPPTKFTWLALGSQGRKEQLLMTDQDNALVFKDKDLHEADIETARAYFLKLANVVNDHLHTIGFAYCPANMMARNPDWCLTLTEWKAQFNSWITHPTQEKILLCNIFFDYDLVYGNHKLVHKMSKSIFESIEKYQIFLNFLGLNALKNPAPLSFFRNFLVEDSGEHKDQFDIKKRAIMPLVDAARLLILSHHIKEFNSTIARYKKLQELEPQNADLYDSCINAFKVLLRYRANQGLKHNDSGRFVDVKSLSKADRLKLKGCFKPVKDIQTLVQVRFQLSQIM
ncbi:MAG TPA: CBS domain-containing protein [Flavobacteriaceae bacterium]|nr:CBS domain-containing protein [Flavobacteriaceae bacterium]